MSVNEHPAAASAEASEVDLIRKNGIKLGTKGHRVQVWRGRQILAITGEEQDLEAQVATEETMALLRARLDQLAQSVVMTFAAQQVIAGVLHDDTDDVECEGEAEDMTATFADDDFPEDFVEFLGVTDPVDQILEWRLEDLRGEILQVGQALPPVFFGGPAPTE